MSPALSYVEDAVWYAKLDKMTTRIGKVVDLELEKVGAGEGFFERG